MLLYLFDVTQRKCIELVETCAPLMHAKICCSTFNFNFWGETLLTVHVQCMFVYVSFCRWVIFQVVDWAHLGRYVRNTLLIVPDTAHTQRYPCSKLCACTCTYVRTYVQCAYIQPGLSFRLMENYMYMYSRATI